MRIRCAWCGSIISNRPPYGAGFDGGAIDGICDDCLAKYFPDVCEKCEKLGVNVQDRYEIPVKEEA